MKESRKFYRLVCERCNINFPSLASDNPQELLVPDYEEMTTHIGVFPISKLRDFHAEHWPHGLTTEEW